MLGPVGDAGAVDALEQALDAVETGDWFVVSGSVPQGTDLDRLVGLLTGLREGGAHLAVDTHGPVLPLLVARATPDLVKINRSEAAELVDRDPTDLVELGGAVRDLGVAVLVLTDGADGAVGWDGSGAWRVRTDAAPGGYPVGSGDSFLAGLVGDLSTGAALPDALVTAAAVGAANAAVPGGALFDDDTLAGLRTLTRATAL